MKHFFYSLIFLTAFIFGVTGYVCGQSASTPQDSIANKVSWLKQKLSLTDVQSTAINTILLNVKSQLDSVKQSSATSQQRNLQLRLINKTSIAKIKNVFSDDQWIRYQGLEATDNESLRQHTQN